jgi:hypothetical protein
VVSGYGLLTQALRQVSGNPLRQPTGVYKHQRSLVLLDQLGQAIIDLAPHLARHHGFEGRSGHFQRQVEFPAVALIDDGG